MGYFVYEKRLVYLHAQISKGRMHSLGQIAVDFGCSTRTIKRMLSRLRKEGFDIRYDRALKRFYIL